MTVSQIRAIRHAGIVVRDLEKSLMFYQDLLGLVLKARALEEGSFIADLLGLPDVRVETAKLSTPDGESQVELLFFHNPSATKLPHPTDFTSLGLTHLAFRVEGIDDLYQLLKDRGIRFIHPPTLSPNGRATVAFCFDPEGNPLELVELHS